MSPCERTGTVVLVGPISIAAATSVGCRRRGLIDSSGVVRATHSIGGPGNIQLPSSWNISTSESSTA